MEFLPLLFMLISGFYDPLIWVPSVATALLIRSDWRASLFVAAVVAAVYGFASGMLVQGSVDTTKPAFAFADPLRWALNNVVATTLIWGGVRLAMPREKVNRQR